MSVTGAAGGRKWFEGQREGLKNPYNTDYLLGKMKKDQDYVHRKLAADPKNQEFVKKDEYMDEVMRLLTAWNDKQDAEQISPIDLAKSDANQFMRSFIQGESGGDIQTAIARELATDSDGIIVGAKSLDQFRSKIKEYHDLIRPLKKKSGPGASWGVQYYNAWFDEAVKTQKFLEDQTLMIATPNWGETKEHKDAIAQAKKAADKGSLFTSDNNNDFFKPTSAVLFPGKPTPAPKKNDSSVMIWLGLGLVAAGVLAVAVIF